MKKISMLLFILCMPLTAFGAVTYELTTEFSGAASPAGTAPWLRATFTDVSGGVELTLTSLLQSGNEKVTEWDFNFNTGALDIAKLSGLFTSRTGFTGGTVNIGPADNYSADGGGYYDIFIDLPSSGETFGIGDSAKILFTYAGSGLDATDFAFSSSPHGGNGVWHTAAHVQGINNPSGGTGDSGWIGDGVTPVPEPGTMMLLGSGLVGLAGWGRKKFRK